ncbi:unnamed protein product [Auanema sp. JU1783]|nr:unnamed protein product [Auanema sp. JU1783]
MIFTQQALMDIYCKTVKKKVNCTMPASLSTDDSFYAGYLGLTFALVCLVIHIILTFIYTRSQKNYITCFISGAYLPITLGAIFKVIHILMSISYPGEHRIGIGFDIVSHGYTVSVTAGVFSVFIGAIVLLFITVFSTCSKTDYPTSDAYSIFYALQMFGWLMSCIIHFCYFDYRPLPLFTACFVIGIAFVVFIVALFCGLVSLCTSGKKSKKEGEEPALASSKDVLLVLLYTILVIVPAGFFFYSFEQEFELISGYEYDDDKAVQIYFTFRLMEYFSGPLITIVVLLLPPVSSGFSALKNGLSGKGKKEGRVPLISKTQVQPIVMATEMPEKVPIVTEPNSTTALAQEPLALVTHAQENRIIEPIVIPGAVPGHEIGSYIPIPPNCTATIVYAAPVTVVQS